MLLSVTASNFGLAKTNLDQLDLAQSRLIWIILTSVFLQIYERNLNI
jgi:hypothetical protein